jgi:hypothetical protein
MNLPVNISADEFLKLIDQLDAGEAVKADEMFNYYMAAMKSRPSYTRSPQFYNAWGYASLYMAGYVSGVRRERARRKVRASCD